jgi:Na+/melibiose symporter-like transporter
LALQRTITSWLGLGVVVLAPPLARKMGKKNAVMLAGASAFMSNCVYCFFGHQNFPIFLTFTIIHRILMGPSGAIGINQWIDAADYQYYRTGRDSRPFIMSLSSMTMKIGQFISSFTFAWILIFCNFVSLGPGQATMDVQKLVWGIYGFQAIQAGISLVIYIIGWRKSDAEFAEYANHNRKVMEERAAAAAAATAAAAGGGAAPAPAPSGGGGGGGGGQ